MKKRPTWTIANLLLSLGGTHSLGHNPPFISLMLRPDYYGEMQPAFGLVWLQSGILLSTTAWWVASQWVAALLSAAAQCSLLLCCSLGCCSVLLCGKLGCCCSVLLGAFDLAASKLGCCSVLSCCSVLLGAFDLAAS